MEHIPHIIVVLIIVASLWKIFIKVNQKGWYALIPFYNLYIIQKIIQKPWWWIILMLIPYIGIIWIIWSTNLLRKTFQKSNFFMIGLIILPFIFYPILGFDDSTYTPLKDTEKNNI